MVKSVKVGIMNTKFTSGLTAGSKCATNNAGQMTTKFPSAALKILTGLCIGQMVMIAAAAGTLGFFVNKNVSLSFCLGSARGFTLAGSFSSGKMSVK